MADFDINILNSHDAADAIPLQYIAAAVLLNWNVLSDEARRVVYETAVAGNVVGLPPTTSLKEQIDRLIRNNAPDAP
ncbi:hypothetical protein NKI59_19470 [Mesorhizobium sp. M0598]|uniref:hypothetical protein n=1 Tax=Mesorhizobium sp. M0598 TaxID=2956968 RepID=UPI003339968A